MTWQLVLIIVAGWIVLAVLLAPAVGIGMRRADRLERRHRYALTPDHPGQLLHRQPRALDRAAHR